MSIEQTVEKEGQCYQHELLLVCTAWSPTSLFLVGGSPVTRHIFPSSVFFPVSTHGTCKSSVPFQSLDISSLLLAEGIIIPLCLNVQL